MTRPHSEPHPNHFDFEALQRLRDAEDRGQPCADTSIDELFRLVQLGYVTGDAERMVKVSGVGRSALSSLH
jgi:hypothetical protein